MAFARGSQVKHKYQAVLAAFAISASAPAPGQQSDQASAIDEAVDAAEAAVVAALDEHDTPDSERSPISDQQAGESVWERGCGDDRGNDRCDDETRKKMLGLYGLESAERLADRNVALFRAMIVDGYGNDTVAVSFIREPGRSPYVDVRAPSLKPDEEQLLRSPVSFEVWETVRAASSNFDRLLASELRPEGDSRTICLHGWVAVAEVVDPSNPYVSTVTSIEEGQRKSRTEIVRSTASVRRDTESACANGLAMPFAFELAGIARKQIGECSALDIDDFRNSATLLALCHRLRGDRHAAAEAHQTIKKLEAGLRSNAEKFDRNFVSMDEEVAERFKKDTEGASIFFGAPNAHSPTDATVEAQLFYTLDEGAEYPDGMATMTIQLYRYASSFNILSWELSERRPFEMPNGN